MELWIRSQNKEGLMQIDNIVCVENRIVFIALNRPGRITLGTYKSRERALEVLDEIQCLLGISKGYYDTENFTGSGFYSVDNNLTVYEMPKE